MGNEAEAYPGSADGQEAAVATLRRYPELLPRVAEMFYDLRDMGLSKRAIVPVLSEWLRLQEDGYAKGQAVTHGVRDVEAS